MPTESAKVTAAADDPVAELCQASQQQAVCTVLLRHGGCPFYSATIASVAGQQADVRALDVRLAIVTMASPETLASWRDRYGLTDVLLVHDPAQVVYRWAGIPRASLWRVSGPRVWWPALRTILRGHFPRKPCGDVRQLPGLAFVEKGKLLAARACKDTFEELQLVEFCRSAVET